MEVTMPTKIRGDEQILNESVTGNQVADDSLKGADVDESSLVIGPAQLATTAFDGILSTSENTVQKAFDKIDNAYAKSITAVDGKMELVGDVADPGANYVYSTNASGVKSFYPGNAVPTKMNMVFKFHNGVTNTYITKTTTGTSTIAYFLFEGTDYYGTISSFRAMAYCTVAPTAGTHFIEWYDETNARIVAQVAVNSTAALNYNTVLRASFSNAPSTGISVCSIRITVPVTNGKTVRLSAATINN
jgi:hypothetical protein